MTKKITGIVLVNLLGIYFTTGCSSVDKTEEVSSKQATIEVSETASLKNQIYGVHTTDIQVLLDATPIGSEISLQEGESGEWHLKIEKVFTVENSNYERDDYIEESLEEEAPQKVTVYYSDTILI